jgi:hypothetical protein
VISRYLVIALALGAAVTRMAQGAWVEAAGLLGLGGGLLALQWARRRPEVKPVAWVGFAVTAVSMIVVLVRMRHG